MEEIKQSIAEEKGFDNWKIMIKCYSTTDVGLKLIDKCINEVLRLHGVSQQRELLLAYDKFQNEWNRKLNDGMSDRIVDDFLANNCG